MKDPTGREPEAMMLRPYEPQLAVNVTVKLGVAPGALQVTGTIPDGGGWASDIIAIVNLTPLDDPERRRRILLDAFALFAHALADRIDDGRMAPHAIDLPPGEGS